MEHLAQHIESLIFTTEVPITLDAIHSCLSAVSPEETIDLEVIVAAIEELKAKYLSDDFAFEIVEVADGYQFLTKGSYFQTIATYLKLNTKKRLSRAAMETLAIIAYKQPVSKSSMEKIRGVSCDYSVQKLLEKELVTIAGRSEGPGRPLLYGTSAKFMDYMGINSLVDLPKLKDFKTPDNEIGEVAPIDENAPVDGTKGETTADSDEQNGSKDVVEAKELNEAQQAIEAGISISIAVEALEAMAEKKIASDEGSAQSAQSNNIAIIAKKRKQQQEEE